MLFLPPSSSCIHLSFILVALLVCVYIGMACRMWLCFSSGSVFSLHSSLLPYRHPCIIVFTILARTSTPYMYLLVPFLAFILHFFFSFLPSLSPTLYFFRRCTPFSCLFMTLFSLLARFVFCLLPPFLLAPVVNCIHFYLSTMLQQPRHRPLTIFPFMGCFVAFGVWFLFSLVFRHFPNCCPTLLCTSP
ncbi:hypothetical protein BDZ97DRAFT_1347981 [Flammula alnicola]|nr:hypothetical protein BDZ97DRAFT_1347981 [Flammula alnicola]